MAIRKSTIHYEIIYDDEVTDLECVNLAEINRLTMEGPCSGKFLDSDDIALTNEQAWDALEEQGSDPSFMDLFKCETCGKVLDIEDSVEENDMLICSECNEKED